MTDPIRILLVDDHPLFREAIARLLAGQAGFVIAGQASTVEEGLRVLQQTAVDIVLLDINLGLQQGSAFPKLAQAQGFTGKILVVTAGVSKLEAARLMERGCAGIVLKQDDPQRLIAGIRAAISGEAPVEPSAPAGGLPETAAPPAPRPLTPRELQVLRGVFSGQTNKEIAYDLGISEPLVKAVIQQLFSKTGVRSRSQLVRVAVESYWKQMDDSEPS